ncbi:MAG: hypothetical protein ACPGN3_04335 [Opitutales bacterium]
MLRRAHPQGKRIGDWKDDEARERGDGKTTRFCPKDTEAGALWAAEAQG